MDDLYNRIVRLCETRQINIAMLCRDNGWHQSLFSDLKYGRKKSLSAEYIQKLSAYFNVPTEYLIYGKVNPDEKKENWIPVLGRVAAGIPSDAIEYIEDYEELSPEMQRNGEYFALKVKGDSMSPRFAEGDVLIVRKQSDCDNNDIAVVLVGNADATVKRVKKTPAGIFLIASNPAYEPKFYSNEDIETLPVSIIGKVVELRAKF